MTEGSVVDQESTPSPVGHSASGAIIAAALRRSARVLSARLLEAAVASDRWRARQEEFGDATALAQLEFGASVEYLARHHETADATWRDLYLGEKLKQLHEPKLTPEAASAVRQEVLRRDRAAFALFAEAELAAREAEALLACIDGLHAIAVAEAPRRLRVLFVGDCLFLDVISFLAGPLHAHGIALDSAFATAKVAEALHGEIRGFAHERFDLVFYSPFTYEMDLDFFRLMDWKPGRRGQVPLSTILERTEQTIRLLSDLFDCPVHVHNTAAVLRGDKPARLTVKHTLTKAVRQRLREDVDRWLRELVKGINAKGLSRLFVLDELPLREAMSDTELGGMLYSSELQHPATLGRALAATYLRALRVTAQLETRKLIVCDLDHTLWEGVIGEGAVRHHADRQQVLLDLKARGVVLAIASKNDPANVRWEGPGCRLSPADFVAEAISWRPKVEGIRAIEADLNLSSRDFLFLDDRPDERAMATAAFPGLLCLDPNAPETWTLLTAWCAQTEAGSGLDRTSLYRDREARKAAVLAAGESAQPSPGEQFLGLGLRLDIRRPGARDIARCVELINRTNQFNLCATRTTPREFAAWLEDPASVVLIGDARDRFGDIGNISVLVARPAGADLELQAFVLSCRVFGYAMETALLNALKRRAASRDAAVRGRYVETPRNQPSAKVLPDHGFVEADGTWVWRGKDIPADAAWLAVREV
jgi:FkbH-like protein